MTAECDIPNGIQGVLDEMYRRYGYDLSEYSSSFVRRRFMNRMNLSGLESLEEMRRVVAQDPQFAELILQDLSINVTEMFRAPSFFLALRQELVPYLRTYPFIKIWDAGCASGEELYSLAILLREEGLYDRVRIYATDFNDAALQKARSGIYPIRQIKRYTLNYQKAGGRESFARYYTADGEHVIFDRSLKENVVFSNHNLVTDEVFNEMQLVLCRNVLIYFNRTLQDRAIRLFRDSLCHNGFLCLGTKETLRFSGCAADFEELSAVREKIFRKKAVAEQHLTGAMGKSPVHERASDKEPLKRLLFEAVVIGVSAGGLNALNVILSSMKADFSLPMIIVQHQYPSASDYLVRFLDKNCPLTVKEAEDKERIAGGTVYIAPPAYHLMIEDDRTFSLSLFERVRFARPSVDVLFESAAEVYRDKLIGAVLTGANDDGSRGLKRIKDLGGFCLVEDPMTAEVNAMPRAALAATEVDCILPLDRIGPFFEKIGRKIGNDFYCVLS